MSVKVKFYVETEAATEGVSTVWIGLEFKGMELPVTYIWLHGKQGKQWQYWLVELNTNRYSVSTSCKVYKVQWGGEL